MEAKVSTKEDVEIVNSTLKGLWAASFPCLNSSYLFINSEQVR